MKKFFTVLLAMVIVCLCPIFDKFTITNGDTGKMVFIADADEFSEFDVTFTHSVNKTPVKEFYKIKDGKFLLYQAEFSSYGAGMSDGTDLRNAEIFYGDENQIFLKMDDEFESLTYYVGTVADHRIYSKNGIIHLNELMDAKSPAVLKIKNLSVFDLLTKK